MLLGLGYIYSDYTHEKDFDLPRYNPTLHIGFGLDYEPTSLGGFGFRLAYESNSFSYKFDENTDAEKKHFQGLGVLYLGVQYKF